ncbi:hypothetical protein [Gordonia rubripertincta]|uniref:hypothetical protein n=1 Tax=Gordonia rubripertincta TaxID=36822 RepID=UPI000B8D7766|nr:hypothetical protein [Gordonia rubripertincta]ASR01181.1 hypothetical protein GCWB2_01755 [Gordonia rubripertincta]
MSELTVAKVERARVYVSVSERLCMWSALGIAGVMSLGFLISGLVPPPAPSATAAEVVDFYFSDPGAMRVGIILMSIGAVFITTFGVAVAMHLRRIEGASSPMAALQLAATAFVGAVTVLYLFILLTLMFRSDRDPDLILLLSDLTWVPFIGMWQPGALQAIAVGAAVLADRNTQLPGHFPRWVGWASLWYAFTSLVGIFVPFSLGGPLGWTGAVPFYLGAGALFGWWILIAFYMLRTTTTEKGQAIDSLDA